jgi:hypothetical protein
MQFLQMTMRRTRETLCPSPIKAIGVMAMAYRKISENWRYQHCREIGVDDDYCILQFRYKDGWKSVATCHPAAIAVFRASGVKSRPDLLKLSSHVA